MSIQDFSLRRFASKRRKPSVIALRVSVQERFDMYVRKDNRKMSRYPENTDARTLVKICGLRRPQDAEAANRVRPDFAGFILSPGFRRSISPEQALALRKKLVPEIRTVGVFVNEPLESLIRIARSGYIDMIQLHGHESDGDIREISAAAGLPIIRAFRISGREDLIAAASSSADWILLDSGAGTGQSFNWALLEDFLIEQGYTGEKPVRESDRIPGTAGSRLFPGGHPWFLAGGLSIENAGEAVRCFHPTAVDVSSNVETDGWKDPAKMEAFVKAVRTRRRAGSSRR